MNKVLNITIIILMIIAFITTAMPSQAGSGTWSDNYGGQLGGVTWVSNYISQNIRWYDGNAHTYRANGSSPYYIYVRVKNFSYCDYPHYISSASRQDNYRQSLSVSGLIGSNQCYTNVIAEGTHKIQVYPGTNYVTGTTTEPYTISPRVLHEKIAYQFLPKCKWQKISEQTKKTIISA